MKTKILEYLSVLFFGCHLAGAQTNAPIAWDRIGAKAGEQYRGTGLSIARSDSGAVLRCVFQKLEGHATTEGLWLTSTASDGPNDRFRVVPCGLGRERKRQEALEEPLQKRTFDLPTNWEVEPNRIRFLRPGLVEEYSVSTDGVRQDFVITQRPAGAGELRLELEVDGAQGELSVSGARLVLDQSGRKLAYNRLLVEDAEGRLLNARIEVVSARRMAVWVEDADAVYPVRIDPTFSDDHWISLNPSLPGTDGIVYAVVADGLGNLYIGGYFKVAGDVLANGIAKWNGSSWSALGSGTDGWVYALALSGTDLYAAGWFTTMGGTNANRIAKWNGSAWSALSSGMNDLVSALAVSGTDLYAGGRFTTAGGSATANTAKWNGNSWSALGSGVRGGDNSSVSALAVLGTELYVGGDFTMAGSSAATNIAKWNGSSWSALGSGMNGPVYALALSVPGDGLYAGGDFTIAGDSAATNIAKWDGTCWSALGFGINSPLFGSDWPPAVRALAVSGSDLYAGGWFTGVGGSNANHIAKWNGSSWSALGSGVNGDGVSALAVSGNDLYAGGWFTTAGGIAADHIAKWNGNSWLSLTSGMNSLVNALAVSGNDLYAGGDFTTAGRIDANHIAKWNGTSWSAVGSGMNGRVSTLAVSGSDLYAGGDFTTAGPIDANHIAKWNGSNWSTLGAEMNVSGSALAVSGSNLYAAAAGGGNADYIAKWNGSNWSALGSGLQNSPDHYARVYALAVSGSNLYAGGNFTSAGGTAGANIAKWSGRSWSPLGSGVSAPPAYAGGEVRALAVSGSNLYAGGYFTKAGGSAANSIAKWDGNSWSALGSGVQGGVSVLVVSGSDLYAGGWFYLAGGHASANIAKWNGASWSALGSGLGGGYDGVNALAVSGSDLYAGGDFMTAGGKVSAYVARAVVYPPVLDIEPDGSGGYFIRFSSVPGTANRLQRAPALAGPWDSSAPQIAAASGRIEFRETSPSPGQTFYRAAQP